MNKLDELASYCKAGVHVTINQHRDYYETVEQYLDGRRSDDDDRPDDETFAKMVADNRVVEVQFYPLTPIGFYVLFGYDTDRLLDDAIEIAKRENPRIPMPDKTPQHGGMYCTFNAKEDASLPICEACVLMPKLDTPTLPPDKHQGELDKNILNTFKIWKAPNDDISKAPHGVQWFRPNNGELWFFDYDHAAAKAIIARTNRESRIEELEKFTQLKGVYSSLCFDDASSIATAIDARIAALESQTNNGEADGR